MSISVLEHVDGSSQYWTPTTSLICSVSGPIEPKARQEIPQHLAIEIIFRPASGPSTTREKLLEERIRAAVTPMVETFLHPRQLCQITFQALKSVGQYSHMELNSAINAAFLALIDAGIPLKSVFTSVTVSVDEDGRKFVNPDVNRLQTAKSVSTVAFKISTGNNTLLLLHSDGSFDESTLFGVLELAEQECVRLSKEFRKLIAEKLGKDFIWKQPANLKN
ncbi:exosome non-catalytic core subunit RRP46 Ecym_1249 [Eremothecium cymbalariae DBVPG|uniref:Exoribonuclease phosphorolytic domain-containing protein n=1 Tax=Eremothecium cymbalariae (strain CBS 270.75 / DBVPG 7215 / KCTC 17166 / NRRL Y-17582) TaxID=931890 RepID=G8JN28_ERECY|nr:hypothetical protein Ecym_1249 [Eremothecium cymbalariae DBVPG\